MLDLITGTTNFHGAFINNGTILDSNSVIIFSASASGIDMIVTIPSAVGHNYQWQFTPSFSPTNWTDIGASQSGTGGVLTFTDVGGVTNYPSRFYRVRLSP